MPPKVTKDVKEAQIDKETLVKIMKDLDKDGDGQVDKEEFKVLVISFLEHLMFLR